MGMKSIKTLTLYAIFTLTALCFSNAGVSIPMQTEKIADKHKTDFYSPDYSRFSGILPSAFRLGLPKALNLINPLAPAEMGFGRGNVVVNRVGKPKGFVALSYKF